MWLRLCDKFIAPLLLGRGPRPLERGGLGVSEWPSGVRSQGWRWDIHSARACPVYTLLPTALPVRLTLGCRLLPGQRGTRSPYGEVTSEVWACRARAASCYSPLMGENTSATPSWDLSRTLRPARGRGVTCLRCGPCTRLEVYLPFIVSMHQQLQAVKILSLNKASIGLSSKQWL